MDFSGAEITVEATVEAMLYLWPHVYSRVLSAWCWYLRPVNILKEAGAVRTAMLNSCVIGDCDYSTDRQNSKQAEWEIASLE